MFLINLFIAFTNLIGLFFINKTLSYIQLTILLCPIITSCLYHLSEKKHNLYGIYPFNKYTRQLLNINRFIAIISFNIIIIKLFMDINYYSYGIGKKKLLNILKFGIIGLISLFISERDIMYQKINIYRGFVVNKFEFLFFHSIWHIVAFIILGKIITEKNYLLS